MTSLELGDITITDTPIDGMLLEIAKNDDWSTLHHATNIDISASDVSDYFLEALASDLFDAIKNVLPPSNPTPGSNLTQVIKALCFMAADVDDPLMEAILMLKSVLMRSRDV